MITEIKKVALIMLLLAPPRSRVARTPIVACDHTCVDTHRTQTRPVSAQAWHMWLDILLLPTTKET